MTERATEPKPKSKLYNLFRYAQKKQVASFDELKEVYCDLFEEIYFLKAAITLGYFMGLAGMSDEKKQSIMEEYYRKLDKGEVKDVSANAQECIFKQLSNTWQVDPRTMQDLKAWLKERGKYFIKEGTSLNGHEGTDQQQ